MAWWGRGMLGQEGSFLDLIPDLPGHLVPDTQGAAPRHDIGFPHPLQLPRGTVQAPLSWGVRVGP